MEKDIKGGKDQGATKQGAPAGKPVDKGGVDKTKEALSKPAAGKDGMKKPSDKT